jgi:hypothetical protein
MLIIPITVLPMAAVFAPSGLCVITVPIDVPSAPLANSNRGTRRAFRNSLSVPTLLSPSTAGTSMVLGSAGRGSAELMDAEHAGARHNEKDDRDGKKMSRIPWRLRRNIAAPSSRSPNNSERFQECGGGRSMPAENPVEVSLHI